MQRRTPLKMGLRGLIWVLGAASAAGQGAPSETIRVKISTKGNAREVLKRLNKEGTAQKFEFVNDESGYVYWIEYAVTEFDPSTPGDYPERIPAPGGSRPVGKGEKSYVDVDCVVHGGNGVDGGYQLSVHRRAAEPALGIEDKVAKEVVKLIAKDTQRRVLLPRSPP